MKNFTKTVMMAVVFILSSSMLFAQFKVEGPAGTNNIATDVTRMLYEQVDLDAGGWTSQDFEAAFDAYDNQGADDFVVPAGEYWDIQSVTVIGSGAPGPFALANVEIYADAAGMPAATPMIGWYGLTAIDNAATLDIALPGGYIPCHPAAYR